MMPVSLPAGFDTVAQLCGTLAERAQGYRCRRVEWSAHNARNTLRVVGGDAREAAVV